MQENTTGVFSIEELEKTVCKVKGVTSARIIADESNNILEIHILAGSSRTPKQIVRDVESSLMIQGNISIDHKKISVVQIQEEDEASQDSCRSRLLSINLLGSGLNAEAKVELFIGETVYEGTAEGPNSSTNRLRLVAVATLNALESFLKGKVKFVVEDIGKIPLGRNEAVNVSVSVITSKGEDIFLGSAFVNNDDRQAVGKAALNAVNRKISLLD